MTSIILVVLFLLLLVSFLFDYAIIFQSEYSKRNRKKARTTISGYGNFLWCLYSRNER